MLKNLMKLLINSLCEGVYRVCRQNTAFLRHSEVQVQPQLHHTDWDYRAGKKMNGGDGGGIFV